MDVDLRHQWKAAEMMIITLIIILIACLLCAQFKVLTCTNSVNFHSNSKVGYYLHFKGKSTKRLKNLSKVTQVISIHTWGQVQRTTFSQPNGNKEIPTYFFTSFYCLY